MYKNLNSTHEIIIKYFKNNTDLSELALYYGTDKGNPIYGEKYHNLWKFQPYTDFYEKLFSNKKEKIDYIFECGIGNKKTMGSNFTPGASLKMWRDYFQCAYIYGADIDKETLFSDNRIQTFLMDQTNENSVEKTFSEINKEFDLIIDDGLHSLDAAKTFFNVAYKYLKRGGIFVIEDISEGILDAYEKWAVTTTFNFYTVRFSPNDNKTCLLVFEK
jgi:hypothetical protein